MKATVYRQVSTALNLARKLSYSPVISYQWVQYTLVLANRQQPPEIYTYIDFCSETNKGFELYKVM